MWRRIKTLSAQGVELQVIAWWFGTPPTLAEITEIQRYAPQLELFEIPQTLTARLLRIFDLLFYPLEVTARMPRGKKWRFLLSQVRRFSPDIIFLDGLHGGVVADRLSEDLQIPLVTRSHNIEHLYYRKILKSAINFSDKFKRYLSVLNLEKYEYYILGKSELFYDISADDLKFWQDRGLGNGRLLSPLIEIAIDPEQPDLEMYDLVFLGNLRAENNVAGIVWFLDKVLPMIRDRYPDVSVLIAGSNPTKTIDIICNSSGVELTPNPLSAADIYRSGRVLINPILNGSGVKIKSVEMLVYNKEIVSTPEGLSGLPDRVKTYFRVANTAREFAEKTIDCLANPRDSIHIDRQLLTANFGSEIIEDFRDEIRSMLSKRRVI
jgi:polysaccharide biosynthesis protein PslH